LENPVYFSTAMNILRNDKLKVIARSDSHAEIIENFANIKVQGIASDWNMSQLQKII
jgi:predicted nuclease with RNAse H fold